MDRRKAILCTFFILVFSMFTGLLILMDKNCPEQYNSLPILPIVTGLILSIVFLSMAGKEINYLLLFMSFLFCVRNIVAPLAMRFGQYSSYFHSLINKEVTNGVILMLYETLFLIFFAVIWGKKNTNVFGTIQEEYSNDIDWRLTLKRSNKLFVIILILVCVGIIVLNPTYVLDYTSIFSNSGFRNTQIGINASGALYTLFTVVMPIAYLSGAVLCIGLINCRVNNSVIKTILNILCIAIPFFFMNNSDGFTLISVVCLALVSLKSGGINRKAFVYIVVGGLGFIIVFIFSVTASMSFGAESKSAMIKISEMLQAYFPGVSNFAGLFHMSQHDKLNSLFYDLYYTIPFRNTIFGIPGDGRLVMLYTNDNGALSQIIPCGAQLFYYLWVLGPVVECWIVKKAIDCYKSLFDETNLFLYFVKVMLVVYLLLTPIMYNVTLFLTRYFITILPMSAMFKLLEKLKL